MNDNLVEDELEILKSRKRCAELWDQKVIDTFEIGTFKSLQQIHYYIFQDIFPFAGKMREINISKGNFMFAPFIFLKQTLQNIDSMPDETFEQIVEKYVEMNIAHPFREGNGRATRIWLDHMLKNRLGLTVNWANLDKYYYLSAMERSVVNPAEITVLLKKNLTDKIYDRETFMKGIQKSYEYEGYYLKEV